MSSSFGYNSPACVSQPEIKNKIIRESNRATFTVDLTAKGESTTLQADESKVRNVLDHLRVHHNIIHTIFLGNDNSTEDAPRLPRQGFTRESKSYKPLTHFLDITVHASNGCLTSAGYLSDLRFESHRAEMRDIAKSEKSLEHNISGLLRSPTSHQDNISWKDVAIIAEVECELLHQIQRLATCARCYLAVDKTIVLHRHRLQLPGVTNIFSRFPLLRFIFLRLTIRHRKDRISKHRRAYGRNPVNFRQGTLRIIYDTLW